MRYKILLALLGILTIPHTVPAKPAETRPSTIPAFTWDESNEPKIDPFFTPASLLKCSLDEIRKCKTMVLWGLKEKDRRAVFARIQQLPELSELQLFGCDLSQLDQSDPLPAKVKTFVIAGGKVCQSTLRWLSKVPGETKVTFGGCDLRGMKFNFPERTWLKFDSCELSAPAATELVTRSEQVIFLECRLSNQ